MKIEDIGKPICGQEKTTWRQGVPSSVAATRSAFQDNGGGKKRRSTPNMMERLAAARDSSLTSPPSSILFLILSVRRVSLRYTAPATANPISFRVHTVCDRKLVIDREDFHGGRLTPYTVFCTVLPVVYGFARVRVTETNFAYTPIAITEVMRYSSSYRQLRLLTDADCKGISCGLFIGELMTKS